MKINWKFVKKIVEILLPVWFLFDSFDRIPKLILTNNNYKIYSNYFFIIIVSFWIINSIKHLAVFIKEISLFKASSNTEIFSD